MQQDPENPWLITEISTGRKVAAWLIRALGLIVGVTAASLYGYLIWTMPPDMSLRQPIRWAIALFFLVPLLLLFGPYWLADRIAGWIDKRPTID